VLKRLTDKNVMSLPAGPGGRAEYTDLVRRGLVLRVTAKGARTYCVRYGAQGRRFTIGSANDVSLADARRKARELLSSVQLENADPQRDKLEARRKAPAETLRKLAGRMVDEADLADRTRYNWGRILEARIYPKLGDRDPSSITRQEVRAFVLELAAETPVQANDALKVLRWVYARALEQDLVETSPAIGVRKPTKETPRDRVLTNAELADLWTRTGAAGLYGLGVRLVMLTGSRKSEVFGARWSEIDEDAKVWRLPAARAKNARPRDLPLVPAAVSVLAAIREAGGGPKAAEWLIPGRWPERPLAATSAAWGALWESEEKSPDFTMHDIRRTVRDRLTRDLRVPVAVAEAIIGHAPPKMIATYAPSGVGLDALRSALKKWAATLERLAARGPA
jgi:integrase